MTSITNLFSASARVPLFADLSLLLQKQLLNVISCLHKQPSLSQFLKVRITMLGHCHILRSFPEDICKQI